MSISQSDEFYYLHPDVFWMFAPLSAHTLIVICIHNSAPSSSATQPLSISIDNTTLHLFTIIQITLILTCF